MLVGIANMEYPDQTASSVFAFRLGLFSGKLVFGILEHLPIAYELKHLQIVYMNNDV